MIKRDERLPPKEMCLDHMASIWDAMHGMAYGVLGNENVHISSDEVPTLHSPAHERLTIYGHAEHS